MRMLIGILLAGCLLAPARGAETAEERGRRVVNEALQALGGDAFRRMQDRVESGRAYSFYRSELSGLSVAKIYTHYLPLPNPPVPGTVAVRERETFGKEEYSAVLLTEEGAWEVTYRGARPLPADRYANFKDSTLRNVFYILRQRLDEPGLTFYSRGSDMYENRPVEIVDITDANNLTVTVYFGQSDKLPVRQQFRRRNPQFKDFDTEVTIFAKYRDVGGGVKWPYDIRRERNGDKIFEMFAESVVIDQSLPTNLFDLPVGVKMLPRVD
ncbi:MAG: hypothetical protein LAQ30_13165 [Acidobacteriia bacterium]|nr:hypothetical protein [Terriglobia bacterium]